MSQAQQQYQAQQAQQVSQTTTTSQASSSQSVAGPSNSSQSQNAMQVDAGTQQTQTQSRMEAERARKDRTLAEFMLMLDDYEPLIPNEVTDYYLQKVGFETDDVRLKRLLALAAQKFVSDIAADAYQHARIRTNATASGRSRGPGGQSAKDKTRTTLTTEDLSAALAEYGINARKPDFYM
ncbi:transcription initiation factor IID, TAF10 subunit [Schizopora paradoxa]|uniref:Transcription initiation factor TFIID subunit 10 n=1 Tax=Schizopora paradoxa TaxID=27342 RepID=A0A0H2RII7_9AGAM|nr:transcription initiation factor IID, TAF10 subunit [Schizopora paradoxa]